MHAIVCWAATAGALILARMTDDAALSDEILTATRDWIAENACSGHKHRTRTVKRNSARLRRHPVRHTP
jgi:hypothetical protein